MWNVTCQPTNKRFVAAELAAFTSSKLEGGSLMSDCTQSPHLIVDVFNGVGHLFLQLLVVDIVISGHQLGVGICATGVEVGLCSWLPDEAEGREGYQCNSEEPVFTERGEHGRTQYQLSKCEELIDLGVEPGMHALHEEGVAELELEFVSFHIGFLSAMAALAVLVVELVVEVSDHLLSVLELAVSTY